MGFGGTLNEAQAFLARAGYERNQVAALRKEGGDLRLRTLVSLFIDGTVLEDTAASDALGDGLEILLAAGLLAKSGSSVRRAVLLVPHEGVLVASDAPEYDEPDYVTGVQRPAHILALLTPRLPVAKAADIGTGCGIHALLASQAGAERVVATDVNERALRLCELNAELNSLPNIETRQGSFLEPLGDETFDLIVSNPPFLISPATDYLFRDAGRGESVSEELVRGLPARLAPGGHAVALISWVANTDEDVERPLAWVADDCGAVLVITEVKDAAVDAQAWIRAVGPSDPEADLERWRSWYLERGITRLAYGALALRRGGHGQVTVTVDLGQLEPMGAEILSLLDAQEPGPTT